MQTLQHTNIYSKGRSKRSVRKKITKILAVLFIPVIAFSLSGVNSAYAATSVILPNGDITTGWTECNGTATCSSPRYTYIDEDVASPNTSDHIGSGTSNSNVAVEFALGTVANVNTLSSLQVKLHARSQTNANGGTLDNLDVQLRIGGNLTAVQTVTPTFSTSTWTTYPVTFNGTWTQSDLDGAQVLVTRVVQGNGKPANQPDNIQIAALSVSATYTLLINYNSSSYRWFNNHGTPASVNSNFATKVEYGTGTVPYTTVSKDFNGDGSFDIATTNRTSDTVSVLINNGDGTFAPKVDYVASSGPQDVDSADYNGDGRPDLAVVYDTSSSALSVYINNGDGTFAAKVDYTTDTGLNKVSSLDANSDGKPDLAVTNYSSASVSIFMNNGNGTFASKVDYAVGSQANDVKSADLNGDNKDDLAVTRSLSATVVILLNNGDGTFSSSSSYSTGSSPSIALPVDFNGDGKLDLATANYGSSGTVSVLLNNGNGTFANKVDYTTGAHPRSVTSADFNGDGKLDLATANYGSSGTVSVLLNNGIGTFANKVDYATSTNPWSVTAADFDGDGKSDVAISNSGSNTISILSNTSTTSLDVASPLATTNTLTSTLGDGNIVRLRLNTHVSITSINAYQGSFKLRYAAKGGAGSCSAVASGSYADVTASTPIAYGDNPNAGNGLNLVTNANDPTHSTDTLVRQNYLEAGTATFSNSSAIPAGQDGMWDFALTTNAATPGNYCLKVTRSNGTDFSAYTVYPELTVPNPVLNQDSYRFYDNTNATSPGTALSANNAMANSRTATPFRLRLLLRQSAGTTANASAYKLQFAEKSGSCSASSYSDVPATAAPFGFNDNATPADDATITTTANDPTPSSGTVKPYTYNENNAFTMTSSLPAGQSGMWDFSLTTTVAADKKTYCLRTVTSGGSTLSAYTYYPEIYISDGPTLNQQMRGGQSVLNGSKTPYIY